MGQRPHRHSSHDPLALSLQRHGAVPAGGGRDLPRALDGARHGRRRHRAGEARHDRARPASPPSGLSRQDARDARPPLGRARHPWRRCGLDARRDRAPGRSVRRAGRLVRRGDPDHAGVLAGRAHPLPRPLLQLRRHRLLSEAHAGRHSHLDGRALEARAPAHRGAGRRLARGLPHRGRSRVGAGRASRGMREAEAALRGARHHTARRPCHPDEPGRPGAR